MRAFLITFLFISSAFAQTLPIDQDWKVAVTASGSVNTGEKFESLGVAFFTGLDTLLAPRGGFESAYREFKAENQLTYGVYQEAEAFRDHLKNCQIDVPADLLAMKLGLRKIFNSQNDKQILRAKGNKRELKHFHLFISFTSFFS